MENKIQIIETNAIELQTRAEVDIAIATAKKYPRDVEIAIKAVENLSCMDQDTAEDCFFKLPRGGKTIDGESIRFAEIVAQCWGNIKCAKRIIGNDGKKVTAQAVVHDLERNIFVSVEVDRKITDKYGKTYSDDMIIMTGNAAASIALRNAILQVVPKGLFKSTIQKIQQASLGKSVDFENTKQKILKHFGALNVTELEICNLLKIENFSQIDKEHVLTLRGLVNAIKDGDTTIDEAFARKNVSTKEKIKEVEIEINDLDIAKDDLAKARTEADITNIEINFKHLVGDDDFKESVKEAKKRILGKQ